MEFLGEFQAEAGEKLDLIAGQLLKLERDPSNLQPVREMFLAAHTIKGGAAMLRLTDVEALAHALEDLLSSFRDGQRTVEGATADLLFQGLDQLRQLIGAANEAAIGAEPDPHMAAFADRLRAAATGEPEPAPSVTVPHSAAVILSAAKDPYVAAARDSGAATHTAPRALVVDDSPTVRALHTLLLERGGYTVDTIGDGQAALTAALQTPYAVVVAGLQLRGLSGFDLARALHAQVPVVLLSADADAQLAQQALRAGAVALLPKSGLHDERLGATLASLTSARAA
jgi:chemotaxis protein histidine kinase CheA